MKKYLIYLVLVIASLSVQSCTKEIEIELEEGDRKLVVDAWFTTEEKVHEIRLTETSDYFSQEATPEVSGALVQIEGGGELFNFYEVSPGVYQSDPTAAAKIKTNYTLTVQYNGQTYQAQDYCDTVPEIDYMDLYLNTDPDGDWYDILIWTTELQGYGHFYCWRTLINDVYLKDTLSEIYFDNDEYLGDGLSFEAFPIEWIWADLVSSGDTVTLEQHNISAQTYDIFEAILRETEWKGDIFDAPPANVPTNLNNGGLGVFVVSSMFAYDYIIP